jgi:hypothetical protein
MTVVPTMVRRGVALWEIAGYIGTSMKMVEKYYAHHHPAYQKEAASAAAAAFKVVKEKRKVLGQTKDRPTRAQVLAERAKASAAPQLHHNGAVSTESQIAVRSKKPRKSAEKAMVGGTGIEPVTPTMST